MLKYKFKLEAFLKLKKIHEETCRNQLGQLMVQKQRLLDEINRWGQESEKLSHEEKHQLIQGLAARAAQFYPEMRRNIQSKILDLENQTQKLNVLIEKKMQELNQKKAELKVVEKLKEKDFQNWKQDYQRHEAQKLEEIVQLWSESQKGEKYEAS